MIHFNRPPITGNEMKYICDAIQSHKISGDGDYSKKCSKWMEDRFGAAKILLTTSGSTALDMALLLCDLTDGDEVILPSYTFSSTANAAVLCGARLVFVDIKPDTMNINEELIEDAITEKTKVIVVMHYAGVSCDMDTIKNIANKYNLKIVEDSAQGMMAKYKGEFLGTIGDFGCYSFHETKNFSMGEGGALVIKNKDFIERAEILREKGTNRSKFFRGQVDKYTWVDFGDSYLPSELNAAYLWAQLERADDIIMKRMKIWNFYKSLFYDLERSGRVELQNIPAYSEHNAHMFYIKLRDIEERTDFISFLQKRGILAPFHYIPLHSAPAGMKFGRFNGNDIYTTKESERLVRLPLYYNMTEDEMSAVKEAIVEYFGIR